MPIASIVKEGAVGASSLDDFVARLNKPRVAWMMPPAAIVEQTVEELSHRFEPGDILVDGGNSHYVDDIRRAKLLTKCGIHYVDSGTSGGVGCRRRPARLTPRRRADGSRFCSRTARGRCTSKRLP